MAALRIIVAIGFLTGLIVVPMTTVGAAASPNNRVSVDNLPGRPAQALTDDSSCSSLDPTDFPESTDLYHFVVAPFSDDGSFESVVTNTSVTPNTRTTTTYQWKRVADFTNGSADVEYSGSSSDEKLPLNDFNGTYTGKDGHLYVAVPTGETLAEAFLNYDISVTGAKTVVVARKGNGNNWTQLSIFESALNDSDISTLKATPAAKYPTQSFITSNNGTKVSHVLSHTCAYPLSPPTISVDTAVGSYEETYTESYSWTLDKGFYGTQVDDPSTEADESITADDLYFDQGVAPKFEITVGRSGPDIDAGSYLLASATVTGTVRLEFADDSDASLSLTLKNGDDELTASSSSCIIGTETATDDVYNYTCTWGGTAPSTSEGVLSGVNFTVAGTVTTDAGTDDGSNDGSFSAASKSTPLGDPANATADLEDDLAKLGAIKTETETLVEGAATPGDLTDDVYETETTWSLDVLDCDGFECAIDEGDSEVSADDKLVVTGLDGNATIVYSSVWDWEQYRDDLAEGACSKSYINTASLSTLNDGAEWNWSTNCPPPTVTLGATVTSDYDVTYDDVYSWTVLKRFIEQDEETLNALYEVVAERAGPTVGNIQGTNVIITGSYTATFAASSNVGVTVEISGETVDCDVVPTGLPNSGAGTFTCTVDAGDLPEVTDETDGWKDLNYVVTATVETAGGNATDASPSLDSTPLALSEPNSSTGTPVNEQAQITDYLGASIFDNVSTTEINENNGYMALNIVCETDTGLDDNESTENVDESITSCGTWASGGVPAGTVLQTNLSANTITLTYELDFLDSLDKSSTCPAITNTASVLDGDSKESSSATTPMDCPTLTITVDHDPVYEMKWDTLFTWTLNKTDLGQNSVTWQPMYQVVATRTAGTPSNFAILDGSQMVSGSIELTVEPKGRFIPTKSMVADLGLTLDTDTTTCTFLEEEDNSTLDTDGYFDFDCAVATESTNNSSGAPIANTSGISGTPYMLTSAGSLYAVDATDVFAPAPLIDSPNNGKSGLWGSPSNGVTSADGSVDIDATAEIVDDTAGLGALNIVGGEQTGTTLSTSMSTGVLVDATTGERRITLSYTVDWNFNSGRGCDQTITNTAKLYRSTTEVEEEKEPTGDYVKSVSDTVTCQKPEPGLTIGFYGNKQGGTQVVDYQGATPTRANPVINGSWRDSTKLPNGAPNWTVTLKKINASAWTSDSQVRSYMTNANCNSGGANSGGKTCQTMFRAQALASVMNAIKNPTFREQAVMFQGACTKVSKLFSDALASDAIDAGTSPALIASRIAYKSIFDDLNNTRAIRCPVGNQ